MEWLFLPGAAIVLWLLVRSARQEQDAISLLHKVQHLEAEHARLLAFVKKELAELSQKRTEAQAARPVEPVEPAQPIRPVEPARPIRPVELAQPIQPVEFAQPIQPVEPAQPIQPVELAQPIQSVQSEEPVPVSVPSVPSFEAQPIPIAETAQPFPVALLSESVSETASLSSPPSASVDQIGPTGPIALATPKKAPGPPPTTPPSTPPGKPFDWEQLLGVRGAAWLGGIALLVAGTLFAKYSIENGLIGPEMRVALLVLLSLGLLSGSEFFMRPKYTVTANAVCGAGIAMLYVAFFAARVLYDLLPTWAAFLLMLLTTVLAVLLSLRYNTMYIAVLGLLGGFATPVSLSTGQDQPVGLFAYVLLLNFGFLWVAVKRLWHKLLSLSLAATLLLQTGWALVHLSPEKLPILVGTSALFALLYVAVTLFAKRFDEAQKQRLLWTATSASVWPFVFVFVLSLMPRYAQHWPQLVALLFCVNVGLLALAVERWALLAWPALFGTIVTELSWGLSWHVYTQSGAFVWIVAGVTILFAVLFGVGPWAYRWRKKTGDVPSELHLAAAGAGLWPLVVGVVLSNERFPQSHGVLFTWLFAAYVWLCVLGLRENRTLRMLLGAGCAAVAGTLWATDGLDASTLWGATGLVSVFAVVGNALPRFASQVQRQADAPHSSAWTKREHLFRELSGAVLLLGLIGFVGVELARELANPPGAFLCVEAVLFVLLGERSRVSGVAFVQGVVSLLYAVLLSSWLFWVFSVFAADGDLSGSRVLWEVSFVLGFAVALGIRAAVRANRGRARGVNRETALSMGPNEVVWDSEWAALLFTVCGMLAVAMTLGFASLGQRPALGMGVLFLYAVCLCSLGLRQVWTPVLLVAEAISAVALFVWQREQFQRVDVWTLFAWAAVFYGLFLLTPLGALWRFPTLRTRRGLFFAAGLAGPAFFYPLYKAWLAGLGEGMVGALPVAMGASSLGALFVIQTLKRPTATEDLPETLLDARHLGNRALFAAVAIGFVALAIPLQLQKQWIAIAWSVEAAAVWWLFRRLPHPGLKYFGVLLYIGVLVRLFPSATLLSFHERGYPVVNWLLYSYGVPCACFLVGAAGLAKVERERAWTFETVWPLSKLRLAGIAFYVGLVLGFVLINVEIADAFSTGRYTELWPQRSYARDLTRSLCWMLYALFLLLLGMRYTSRGVRYFSLGLLLLTVGKVFLYDLSNLSGMYRPLSLLGLAAALIVVSLLYSRFVFQNKATPQSPETEPEPEKEPEPEPEPEKEKEKQS